MEDIKISVIVPVYNICDYLGKCIDSIMNQTHSNLEIIVIDDGSSDNTQEKLNIYAKSDNRIKVIYQKNGGVTRARLRGVWEARGKYIGFVDGDDYIEPHMYERLITNAEKYSADISHCGYQMIFPDGHVDYYYNSGRFNLQSKTDAMKELLCGTIEPGLCNKLFRRELLQNLIEDNLMNFNIKNNEDLLMNYYLFEQAKRVVFEDICPYHYILRKNSAATAHLNEHKLKDPIEVLRILQANTQNEIELKRIIDQRLIYQMISVATMSLGKQKELIGPYRKAIRKELKTKIVKIAQKRDYSKKLRIMAIWTVIWPASYSKIHKLYLKAKGIDKKYNVE